MKKPIDYENSDEVMKLIVENGELPQYIYKYTDVASLKLIIENSTLKFSKPSDFNDPFDCNLTIDTENTTKEIDDYIDLLRRKKNLNSAQIKILKQKYHNPKTLFELTNKSIKQSKENIGATCFSKLFDNILMWSHYSDKHKGVCLKFDLLADVEFFIDSLVVEYHHECPKYNYIKNREGLGQFLFRTKSIDWTYENEIRVVKRGHGFYKFNKDSLVEIIFGAKTPNSERNEIIKLINELKYDNIVFKSSKISELEFKLEIE